jgi:hypothetical protein
MGWVNVYKEGMELLWKKYHATVAATPGSTSFKDQHRYTYQASR